MMQVRLFTAALAVAAGLLGVPAAAHAADPVYPPEAVTGGVTRPVVTAGSTVSFGGSGFRPGETISVVIRRFSVTENAALGTENLGAVGDWAVPMVIIGSGSFLNTLYTRRIPLVLAWVGTFALQAIVSSLVLWSSTGFCPVAARLSAMTGVAFILFTFYMVTDPATTPERPAAQIAFGASVALVYSLFLMKHIVYGLFMALVIVCVARGLVMYLQAYLSSSRAVAGSATVPGPMLPEGAAP